MACILTTGRKLPCKDVVGGISEVLFADFGTLGNATISNSEVTAFSGTPDIYKYDVKSASGLEQTINSSDENGTTFYDQSVTLVLTKLDKETQSELSALIVARPHCFVKTNNGKYFAVGMTRGCSTSGTITSGQALGDLTGYTLTIMAQEPLMSLFVDATMIETFVSGTQIAP